MPRKPPVVFEWKGVEEMKRTLQAVGASLDDTDPKVKGVLIGPALAMRDDARRRAPKRTGALAAAIYATKGGAKQRGVLMGVRRIISMRVEGPALQGKRRPTAKFSPYYGHMIEFGTSKMAAHPFFRPAFLAMGSTFVSDIAPGIKKIVEDTAAANAFHP